MDYAVPDLIQAFTPEQAAIFYCEQTVWTPERRGEIHFVREEIIRALRSGEIKTQIKQRKIPGSSYWHTPTRYDPDYNGTEIPRKSLKDWFEKRDQKPKFLFPEMRESGGNRTALEISQQSAPEKREHDLHSLIARVYKVLTTKDKKATSKQVLREIEENLDKYDHAGLIQEIKGNVIYWQSMRGQEQEMSFRTFENVISQLRKNHGYLPCNIDMNGTLKSYNEAARHYEQMGVFRTLGNPANANPQIMPKDLNSSTILTSWSIRNRKRA